MKQALSRRALVTTDAAALDGTAVAAAPLSLASAAGPDPVLALMEKHRAIHQAREDAPEDFDDETSGEMTDAEWDAWEDLLECRPTTLAGAIAFTAYVAEFNQTR